MSQLSAKLRKTDSGYSHWCPACEEMHNFYVDKPTHKGARWSFDGNVNRPTFAPSMNISSPACDWGDGEHTPAMRCHYILTVGQIQFCGDCTHAMVGKVIELPDLPVGIRSA